MPLILPRGGWGQQKPPAGVQIDRASGLSVPLIGSWDFREGGGLLALDAVSGYHARIESGIVWSRGSTGSALKFNTTNKVFVPATPRLHQLARFSVEALVYWDSATTNQAICEQTGASNTVNLNWLLFFESGALKWRTCFGDLALFVTATYTPPANGWYHIIGTYDGTSTRLWVNGVLRDTQTGGNGNTNPKGAGQLRIGILGGDFYPFAERIEFVRVYDGAVAPSQAPHMRADPYQMFAPPVWRRYFMLPPSGSATGTGAITIGAPAVAGTGTVLNPPTVVGAGTAAYTATNGATIAPGLPSGWAANDIHVLIAARGDNTAMTSLVGSGWASLSAANNTAAFRVEVWWRRAVGGDAAPTITFGSGTVVRGAQIIGIRGCPTNVDPFAVPLSRSDNAASATVTFATITPDQATTLLLALYAYEDDPSAASQITDWSVFTVSTSALGTDMSLGYASRVWTTANSATGALTSTVSGGTFTNSPNTGVILSLAPVAPSITGTGDISLSPPVVDGTGTSSAPSNDGAITIGAPQLAGTGTFTTTGSGAISIGIPVVAGTGSFATVGSGAVSIGIPVIAGTGSFATTGTGAVSIGIPVLAATGSFATTGTASISIGIPVLAATGTVTGPPGSGDIGIAPPVLAGTGTFTTTGSGAIAVLPPAIAAVGSFATTGSGAISIGGPAVAGSGSAVDPGTGSGAISIAAPVLAASGTFTTTGAGALSVAAPVVAGTGTFTPLGISGTGAVSVGGPQIAGTGSFATTGAGTVTVGAPAVAGTGTYTPFTATGTGTITIPAPVVAGTGTLIYTGSGTITIPGPLLSGYSVLATRAAASDSAYGGAVGSDAAYTGAGAGDLALVGAAASDEEV